MGIKNKLKEIRMREYMMKQKEFAEFLGVNSKSYFSWEKETIKPSVEIALEIAKKLNRSVEDIWYLDN